ncbi:polypeptide N-acetylgalactosaminyltransferase 5 [Tachysurus fulvidraco]|uniref:polypeptide N-acetylgalactosaminyltransferase 5 n=1 Tax=Tachysurus fulvidraco TaxID=1234273 RepID=UPI001FF0744D|nr:polypeptide N-acetylgalactosaminyltransferase 5 [Tachysurus fulvidraco]
MKISKYLRGSGRVLAFVFVASVLWLLFDMAALRLSNADLNGQLMKDLVLKERELDKKINPNVRHHRVQKVNPDMETSQSLDQLNRPVVEVYRRKKPGIIKAAQKSSGNISSVTLSKSNNVHIDTKSFGHKGTLEKQNAPRNKVTPGAGENLKKGVLTKTKAPSAGQEGKLQKLQPNISIDHQIPSQDIKIPQQVVLSNKSDSTLKKVQKDSSNSIHTPTRSAKQENSIQKVQIVDKSVVKDNKTDSVPVNAVVHVSGKPSQAPLNASKVQTRELLNSTGVSKQGGLHKVMTLDSTLKPRDSHAVGQFGWAAVVAPDDQEESKRRWSEGYFNVFLSEQIPVDRAVPDTRPPACSQMLVHNDLPTTSVIFCFVDEVWSTLLRSVHSVLNRSPPHLLKEVLLVDDCSTKDYLKDKLDIYMSQFPKVRIIRLKERHGLIRARLAGAAEARGDVLTFLDSHIECNVGWLEPLLDRVYLDRRKVVCPVIEVINDKDMSYVMVDNFQRGIFKWPLVFGWSTLPNDFISKNNVKVSDPLRCPVMAGGLFSIDRKYFYELGTYDPGLDVWGGENMEISFKIWMCGGEIEIIPCSRVGHIFRGENPYGFPKDRQRTVERNLARVAEVWLDEYKEIFYGHSYLHLLDKNVINIGNLTAQIQLREKLHCKSFKWYLENIYPELEAPLVKAEGLVFNVGNRKCLVQENGSLSFEICDLSKQNQHFSYSWVRTLRQNITCVSPQATGRGVALEPCDNTKAHHRWLHKSNKFLAEHLIAEVHHQRMCLEAGSTGDISMKSCDASNSYQQWHFTHYYAQ